MSSFVPYGRQVIDERDVDAVVAVLRSDRLTQGPAVDAFEADICRVTQARHAVAFSSGTAALHAACAVAGLGPGDQVAAPSLTFAATVASVLHVGATPLLVDIDPATLNIDLSSVPEHVDAVIPVHYAGLPVDLAALSRRPRIVIEDAAHALGAMTPEGPIGSCSRSDLCCFSFHPVKPITSGEGGAVTTNDASLAAGLRSFRSHSTVPAPDRGPWAYDVTAPGFNFRLTDLHAALGSSQLGRLEDFIERRTALAARYRDLLAHLPLTLPPAAPAATRHGYHLFAVQVPQRERVYRLLHEEGIGVQVHYVPIHHHTAFRSLERATDLTETDRVYAGLLSLPLFPTLTELDQDRVVGALTRALEAVA